MGHFLRRLFLMPFLFLLFSCGSDPELRILGDPWVEYSADSSEITIHWETNLASDSRVSYGLTADMLDRDTLLTEEREQHSVPMLFLQADTLFFFRAASRSEYFDGRPKSDIFAFRTNRWYQKLSPELYVRAGWKAWLLENYQIALNDFSSALALSPNYIEAFTGIGWASLYLPDQEERAYEAFNDAIYRNNSAYDAYCGRALLYLEREQFRKSAEDLEHVLSAEPSYRSEYIPDHLFVEALRCILASAYYSIGQFDKVQSQLDLLDPDNGLTENNPSTWTVSGGSYGSYIEAQLALLMELSDLYVVL